MVGGFDVLFIGRHVDGLAGNERVRGVEDLFADAASSDPRGCAAAGAGREKSGHSCISSGRTSFQPQQNFHGFFYVQGMATR